MMYDDHAPPSSPAESWPRQSIQPNKKPNRWRAIAAVASAIAIIALFALLLRGFADGKGSPSPLGADGTATADATTTAQATPSDTHGKWQVMDSMTYSTTVFTQTPYPVFSPKDPAIVYETSMSPVSLRRSDDGGVTWQPLDLPPGSDQAIVIEIFASPLDAHSAFLTVTVNMAYGQGLNACPSSARASVGGATHGNILASGQAPCSTTYRTTDEGQSWKKISFPVNGTISTPYSEAAPFAGTLLQAQGTRLYALLGCGPTCGGSSGRLVRSSDGGATWRVADGGVGQGVCDFATLPASQTIFATVSNGSCDAINSPAVSLYRSNNGGAGWLTVGALPKGASSQGMAAVMVGGKPVLVMNLPQVSWQPHIINVSQSADEFAVSNDGGHTWKTSPLAGAPTKALPIVAPLIVRADGSLVVSFTTSEDQGQAAKLYTWRPGEASWRIFAPAPDGHLSTLRYTVSPNGDETFWAVVKSATTLSGNDTYSVARYQP